MNLTNNCQGTLEELIIEHKNTHLKLITTGNTNHTSGIIDHIVYRITTMNEEVWVMDISGAQFEYPRPLESWPTYERDQVQRICKQGYLGTSKNAWLDRAASFPENSVPLLSSVLKQELHISEVLDGEIWQWFLPDGKLRDISKGTEEEFEGKKRVFLDDVENTIRDAMIEIKNQRPMKSWQPGNKFSDMMLYYTELFYISLSRKIERWGCEV